MPDTAQEEALAAITLGDQLQEMIPVLHQTLEQGEAHYERLKDLARAQDEENKKTRRLLSVVDPEYVHPQAHRKGKSPTNKGQSRVGQKTATGVSTGFGISVEAAESYAEEIKKRMKKQEFITQTEIYKALGRDQGQCSSAFRFFRDIGFLGKAGRDKVTGRENYRVLDAGAYDKVLAGIKE